MRSLYNILFLIFFVLSSPYYFLRMSRRGNWQKGFAQRFGNYDVKLKQSITNRHIIWLHAVSVGEMNVCMQLIRALEPRLPNVKFVVSTTTTTAMSELQKKLPPHIGKIYYPVDRRKFVARALGTIRPDAIILVEAEIWPNFIWRARSMGIPLFLVNARLSDRSFPRYKKFKILFKQLFGAFTGVGAQNETDAGRLGEVGCRREAIHVVGNLKFDAAVLTGRRTLDVPAMLGQLGVPTDARILVAGSTHDGEELILAEIFLNLKKQFPDLFLILVPRHFERAKSAGNDLSKLAINFFYRSELAPDTQFEQGELDCLLVNTTGELRYFYEHATVVFVGKSLAARGGQNPIEPAALGKPVLFGPNMQNFTDVVKIFLADKSAIQVSDAAELETRIGELLSNPPRRQELGYRAQETVKEHQGATERTVEMILEGCAARDLYTVPKK
ncbi:3-deoxy-D-manno-octulosonic acid transferase [Pedosphaera parvula]|uniref:3-deoxy-D-manno-octulosonic acid transferase n=1 Tax=Pedosphaera parvula (strain Ellin514) TaxID=320771 RepID=B9XBG0_PEDPL|nr:3-deoxy-D-manno-octulosonic acid transferase [Pedosphaera parvula]EEF62845.1 Three-deoxy-D-manno-octulosonic-acid transferase domain protein [Pedosphaera parvula Ellin514]